MRRLTRQQAQVKLDIDHKKVPTIQRMAGLLRRAGYRPVAMAFAVSPSGRGWHVWIDITPRPLSPFEVVALSTILGSEPSREAMQMVRARSFVRAPQWMRNLWNVLYTSHPQRQRHLKLEERIPWEPPS